MQFASRLRTWIGAALVAFGLGANAGGIGGALSGMGEAMQDIARQSQSLEDQKELMRQQYELETQREMDQIRRQYQFQQQAEEQARLQRAAMAKAASDQAAADAERARIDAKNRQDEIARGMALLDNLHPGWRQTIVSKSFVKWMAKKSDSERQQFETTASPYLVSDVLWRYKEATKGKSIATNK